MPAWQRLQRSGRAGGRLVTRRCGLHEPSEPTPWHFVFSDFSAGLWQFPQLQAIAARLLCAAQARFQLMRTCLLAKLVRTRLGPCVPARHPPRTLPAAHAAARSVSTRRLPYNAAHPIPVIGRLSAAEEEMLKVKVRAQRR